MALLGRISDKRIFGTLNENKIRGNINFQDKDGKITYPYLINPYDSTVSPYCEEATALFARMAVQSSTALKELIDKTITDLKAAGIWDITDKLHKWDLHTEQASLLDWKYPAHNATNVGGATFTPKYGLSTTQYVNYIDLNFIPSTDSINGTLNDFAFSLDDLTGEATISFNFGAYNTSNTSFLGFRTMEIGAIRPWLYINSMSQKVWNSNGGINLYYNERPSSSVVYIYKSPTTYTLGTSNSVSMINQSLILGGNRINNGGVNKYNISTSSLWLGKSMTAGQRASWYEIITYWKANIGSTF